MAAQSPWLTDPVKAHEEWRAGLALADRAYAEHSQQLYNSLFGRFCRWLAGQQCNLKTLRMLDLARFLDTLKGRDGGVAANRTQRTYVAEIDRVFAHLQNEGLRTDNPARKLLETLRITTPLRPRTIRVPKTDTRERYLESLKQQEPSAMTPEAVQAVAMNFLMLDCGFTLKELQKLLLSHLEKMADNEIKASGHRTLLPRQIPLTPEARQWLERWLVVRKGLKVVSRAQYKALQAAARVGMSLNKDEPVRSARAKVFVSFAGKAGKLKGLRGTGLAIDYLPDSTIYLGAQQVLMAGRSLSAADRKAVRNKGPQALRNLCCATMVAEGLPSAEIAAFLGLWRSDQVWAMARAIKVDKP
jgi:site-specific recombinase XerD